MKTNVIQVDFAGKSPDAEWSGRVVDFGRQAARALVKHASAPAEIHRVEGDTCVTARVKDAYRLEVTVGAYSTLRRRPLDVDIHEWRAMREAAPRELVFEVVAEVEWLRDQALATEGNFGCEHACVEFASLEAAVTWVRENCKKISVARVSAEELVTWGETFVAVPPAQGGTKSKGKTNKVSLVDAVKIYGKVSLVDAVKIYGPIYGAAISADVLVKKHGLSPDDAYFVARSVKKIAPKRKT